MAELLISRANFRAHGGRLRAVSAISVAAAMLTACAGTRGGPIPYEPTGFTAPDAPEAAPLGADYRIAPLDTLRVNVFQVEDLSAEYQVDLNGNIGMPLIGNVPAVGLTIDQLQESLVRRLAERYLANPDVTVGVANSTQRVVTVDGSVRRPGAHPILANMTLMQAVAMAGGTDENSNPRRVAIFRQIEGQRMAAAFDLVSIRRGEMEDPRVFRGDIIVVDGSQTRSAWRDALATLPVLALFRPF